MDKKYYVYLLIDPLNDKIFYVGKGSKNRLNQHEKNVKKNDEKSKNSNPYLFRKIKKILERKTNNLIEKKIISYFDNEQESYEYEKKIINEIGLKHLCNINEGGNAPPIQEGKDNYFYDKHFNGESNPFYGKHHSEESKQRMSESKKNKYNGENHPRAKLTQIEVNEIRKKYKRYIYTAKMLANEYCVSVGTIKDIISRKRWNYNESK